MGLSHEKTAHYAFQRWLPPLVSLIGVINYILLVFMSFTSESFLCVWIMRVWIMGGGGVWIHSLRCVESVVELC